MDFINAILISVVFGACCGVFGYVNSMLNPQWQLLRIVNWGLLVAIVGVSFFAALEWGIEAGAVVLVLGGLAAGSAYRQQWSR